VVGDGEKGTAVGRGGLANQLHVGFLRRTPGLLTVAVGAGTDHIFPGVLPSPVARYHVVEREVPTLLSAVLAGVLIAVKNLVAGHLALAVRPPDKLGQPDDGGKLKGVGKRVDIAKSVLEHLRLALVDKDDGAAGPADRKRLVTLVEDEHRMV